MTRRVEEPEPVRDGAGHGPGDEPAGTSGSSGTGEPPTVDASGVGAAGLDLSRPWQQVPWVVIDVEGNGQRPPDLVEAACLPIDGGVLGRVRTWLVRPPRPITGPVRRIHGIRNADVAAAPATADVAEQIRAELAGRVVIGHHVHVDLAVLGRELGGWTAPSALDTLRLAKAVWPGLPSYSLDNLTTLARLRAASPALLPLSGVGGRHRAGYDTTLTAALFLALAHTVTHTATEAVTRAVTRADTRADRATDPGPTTAGGALTAARLLVLAGAIPANVHHDDAARLF